MAKTYMGSGGSTATVANETSYWMLGGEISKNTTETNNQVLFRSAGTLSNLYVRVPTNTIAGASTFKTRKNAADGGQSVSIGSSATGEFTDSSGTDTIAAGDKLNYQFIPGAATNTMTFSIQSCIFSATTDTVTRLITFNNINQTTASTTWFHPLCGDTGAISTTETNAKQRIRKAGTLKNACFRVTTGRATASTGRSRKNGANGNANVSMTAGATGFFEDTVNTDTVSVDEDWNWSITTGTGVDTLNVKWMGGDFVSTASIGIIGKAHMTTIAYADAATGFTSVSGFHSNVSEANAREDCRIGGVYSNLSCLVTQNDVTSASTLTLRKNGADTTLIASITGSTTGQFQDNTHTETLVSTDEINYEITIPSVSGAHTVSICNYTMYVAGSANIVVTMGTETVTVGESLARLLAATRAPATENTTIGETMAIQQVLNRPLSTETTTISESPALNRSVGRNRALGTETTTIGESMAVRQTLNRALSETTVIGESLARMLAANRSLATETVTVGESLVRVKGVIRALATETVTIGENLTRLLTANRALNDTVVIGENLIRLLAANRSLATETVVIGESLNRMLAATRALATETVVSGESLNRTRGVNRALGTETVTVGESLTRMLAANRVLSTETVTVGESLTRLLAAIRALSDTTTISENLSYVYSPGGEGPNKVRALSDTVIIGESISRMLAANRALATEVTAISESLDRQLAANRALSDTTVIGESLTKLRTVIRSLVTETVSIGESLVRQFTGTRPIVETTAITDSLTKLLTQTIIPTQLKNIVSWLRSKYSISTPPKDPSY